MSSKCLPSAFSKSSKEIKIPQSVHIDSYGEAVGGGTWNAAAAQAALCPFLQCQSTARAAPQPPQLTCAAVGPQLTASPAQPTQQPWEEKNGNEWENTMGNGCAFTSH